MAKIGYKLCSEEQSPQELIDCARRAEEVGFDFAMISDHYHPWIDRQGQSSFVWSVLGGLSRATERITIGTAVTCGPDPERYLAKINDYVEAGFDHVWLHQVGPDQEGFFRFFEKEVFPKLDRE